MSGVAVPRVVPGMSHEELISVVEWITTAWNNDGSDGKVAPLEQRAYEDGEFAIQAQGGGGNHQEWYRSFDGASLGQVTDSGFVVGAVTVVNLTVSGTALLNGAVTLGNEAGDAITVTGTPTFAQTATFNGAVVANGAVTLGNEAGDAITVNGTPTFATAVSILNGLTVGDANTDVMTVVGVTTFRNALNTATQLFVDAGNNRVVVGSATALASDLAPNLQVVGRLYVAPDSANDLALELRRSSALATPAIRLGLSAAGELVVKDETDTVVFLAAGAVYALDVTGDVRVSDDFFAGARAAIGAVAFSGAEELRVVGQSRFEGEIASTSGGIVISGSNNIDGNGGTAGQLRIGAVIVNQASLTGAYKLEITGDFLFTGNGLITGGIALGGSPAVQITNSSNWQTTRGAGGAATALTTPLGYLQVNLGGTPVVVPYYLAS